MHRVAVLALSLLLPASALAYSPKQPEQHKRYSPNGAYFIDFDPKSNVQSVFADASPDESRWSIKTGALWPYKKNESDGCLFLTDDGSAIAGLTWMPAEGKPAGYRQFEGLEFWRSDGTHTAYRLSQLSSGTVPVLDLPVRMLWHALSGSNSRGGNVTRYGSTLYVTTFGMRSFIFSMHSGQRSGWYPNLQYFIYFALVYAVPVSYLSRWIRRLRRRAFTNVREEQTDWNGLLLRSLGSLLVVLNSFGFALGVYFDSFGGRIDQIGAQICRATGPMAGILIPVTVLMSFVGLSWRPRHFDLLGPWLAIMSAVAIHLILYPH